MRRSGDSKFFLQSHSGQADGEQSGNEGSTRTVEGLGELDNVDSAIFDGWHHLGIDSEIILSKTPREFSIMMSANVERVYDEYELRAVEAMMTRSAYHAKKLKQSDLFKRPTDEEEAKKKAEESHDKKKVVMDWMSNIAEFQGADIGVGGDGRKEGDIDE